MSIVHIVKVTGKSRGELVQALKGALREMESGNTGSFNLGSTGTPLVDEYEDVESPYSSTVLPEYGEGPGTALRAIVVDNELDVEGIPWDSRIHSNGRTKINDGSWKKRKGVEAALVATIKNELRNRVSQNTTPSAPLPFTPTPQAIPEQAPVVQQQAVNAPALPGAPAIPQMQIQSGHTVESFKGQFAQVISSLITQGKITADYINTLKNHFGVTEIWMANDDQKVATFNEFVKCQIIQQVA